MTIACSCNRVGKSSGIIPLGATWFSYSTSELRGPPSPFTDSVAWALSWFTSRFWAWTLQVLLQLKVDNSYKWSEETSNWFWPQGWTFLHVIESEIIMRLLPAHCFYRTLLEVGQGGVYFWISALMHPVWLCPHPLLFWVPNRIQQCFPLQWLGGSRSSQACEWTVH